MPTLRLPEPPLDRAGLLFAVLRAASATASGEDDREIQRKLDGKPFELRIRFGCGGPSSAEQDDLRGWTFDERRRVLRIRASPGIGKTTPLIKEIGGDLYEAVEGFRIARPWMLSAACPQIPPAPQGGEAAEQNDKVAKASAAAQEPQAGEGETALPMRFIGIAQFFAKTDARTHRRDHRAYQVTKTLAADESPSAKGYDLVLSGRLKRLDDDRVITCRIADPDAPPSCIIAAEFDTVKLERGDNAEQLAQWSSG